MNIDEFIEYTKEKAEEYKYRACFFKRGKHGNCYKAFWQNNYYQFSWICVKSDIFSIGAKWDLWSFKSFEIEVIGNIFDNKELLESEEN